jgi:hypothetical protein
LQQQINECNVDRIVDSTPYEVLDNDSTKMELNGHEVTNPRWFGLVLVWGSSQNLLKLDSLLLPNFPTQYYTPLSKVAKLGLYVPRPQELLAIILYQPTQPLHVAMSGQSVFDMIEDLLATDMNAE